MEGAELAQAAAEEDQPEPEQGGLLDGNAAHAVATHPGRPNIQFTIVANSTEELMLAAHRSSAKALNRCTTTQMRWGAACAWFSVCALVLVAVTTLHAGFVHQCQLDDDLVSRILGQAGGLDLAGWYKLNQLNQTNASSPVALGIRITDGDHLSVSSSFLQEPQLALESQDYTVSTQLGALGKQRSVGALLLVQAEVGRDHPVWRGAFTQWLLKHVTGYDEAVLNSVDCYAERRVSSIYLYSHTSGTLSAYSAAAEPSAWAKVIAVFTITGLAVATCFSLSFGAHTFLWLLFSHLSKHPFNA